mgnify:CR=1 FL=1
MKIHSVRIKNFRTLTDINIPFDSVTTFIGPNGAGKSSVLRALDWFFNGKVGMLPSQTSLREIVKHLANTLRREQQHSLPGGYARPTVQKGFLPTQKVSLILTILKLLMEQQRRRICTTLFEKHILNSIFPLPRPGLLSKKQ